MKTRNLAKKNGGTDDSLYERTKNHVFSVFSSLSDTETTRRCAISGGPDSVLATSLLVLFCKENAIPTTSITLLYFDHKQRDGADDSVLIKTLFPDLTLIQGTFEDGKATEELLRKARRAFFEEAMSVNGGQNVLITGHTLSDRVETTFLNMLRGCQRAGFLNMRQIETKKHYTCCRPLLSITKDEVLNCCSFLALPFVHDDTNDDVTISKRNYVRQNILPALFSLAPEGKPNSFYRSFASLYAAFEDGVDSGKDAFIQRLQPSAFRGTTRYGKILSLKTPAAVYRLLSELGIGESISTSLVDELFGFFVTKPSGRKFVKGRYFFKSHGAVYCIQQQDPFWKHSRDESLTITHAGLYKRGDFERTFDEDAIGGTLRYAHKHDVFKKKPLSKFFISQKVPVFWRNYLPVLEKNHILVQVYPFHTQQGRMY